MFAKKLQNGHEKLKVHRFNKKIRGRKVKNNGIEVSNFAASLYKVTMFKGFFKIEPEYKINIHYQIKFLCL